ncbi:hypothetical protein OAH75_06070, partial [Nitrosopumilus sp.]
AVESIVKKINPKEIFIKEVKLGTDTNFSDCKLFRVLSFSIDFSSKKGVKIKEPIINHVKVNFFEYFFMLGTNYGNKF